jgi:hypothetical protein
MADYFLEHLQGSNYFNLLFFDLSLSSLQYKTNALDFFT